MSERYEEDEFPRRFHDTFCARTKMSERKEEDEFQEDFTSQCSRKNISGASLGVFLLEEEEEPAFFKMLCTQTVNLVSFLVPRRPATDRILLKNEVYIEPLVSTVR